MARPDKIIDVGDNPSSLWLVIRRGIDTLSFEFEDDSARIVTVGSAPHSDVRLYDSESSPLVCYFERDGDKLWLVPGYRYRQLRADTTLVERPRRLGWRSVVEFAGVTLEVRVREEPPTSPDNVGPILPGNGWGGASAYDTDLVGLRGRPLPIFDEISCSPIVSVGEGLTRDLPRMDSSQSFYDSFDSTVVSVPDAIVEPDSARAPLSTSPSVVSLRLGRTPAFRPLAVLGELTRRRPVVVALWASLGSVGLVLVMSAVARFAPTIHAAGRDMPPTAAITTEPIASQGHAMGLMRGKCVGTTNDRCSPIEQPLKR